MLPAASVLYPRAEIGHFVIPPPSFDDDLRFVEALEYLFVQKLVPESGVEALAMSILPRRAWFDESSLAPAGLDPLPDGICDELWADVTADELVCLG